MNLAPDEALVFQHIPKTAGTTIHDYLVTQFPPELIAPYRFDTLRDVDPDDLRPYRFFSGHYNRASVDAIPRPVRVFTFLRNPADRILSLYYFWRGHTWDFIEKADLEGPRIAKSNALLDFLRIRDRGIPNNVDNIMTRTLIGPLDTKPDGSASFGGRTVDAAVDAAIDFLSTCLLVGFQDTFEQDATRLAELLGLRPDPAMFQRRTRAFTDFATEPNMEPVEREPMTPEIAAELDRLTRADQRLYERAQQLFGRTDQ